LLLYPTTPFIFAIFSVGGGSRYKWRDR